MIVMKPFKLFLALCAGVGVIAAGSAFAKTPVTSPTNVFSGPGSSWPVVSQIPAGAHVDVMNCYGGWNQGWCQVHYGKVKGFVRGVTLAPAGHGNVAIAPVVAAVVCRKERRLICLLIDILQSELMKSRVCYLSF